MNKVEKLLPRLGLIERSRKITGRSHRVLLFHSTHLHTHVPGFHYNHHAQRIQRLLYAIPNL